MSFRLTEYVVAVAGSLVLKAGDPLGMLHRGMLAVPTLECDAVPREY